MKYLLILIALEMCTVLRAQNYLISFTGAGASTTVDSIKVENLSSGESLKIKGNDLLRLTGTTGICSIENKQSSNLKIYPNPMSDNSTIEFTSPFAGNAIITVRDITGRMIVQNQSYLYTGLSEFCLSGLNRGIYLITVKGISYQYSGKLICNANINRPATIEIISNKGEARDRSEQAEKMDSKGAQSSVIMAYIMGDRLKFTGISGNFRTVKTDIPAGDKTITFSFMACTDGDGINYPVVDIGGQIWMGENLKTTSYNDTSPIPLVTVNSDWAALSTSGYCWYNNDIANQSVYGALYNWYVVNTNKLCPAGWHVPGTDEWNTLTTFLGGNSIAGGKLKETGLSKWFSPNAGATNETGFTALPGSARSSDGSFSFSIGTIGFWWTSVSYGSGIAYYREMWSHVTNISYVTDRTARVCGFSVRCIKDN